jgi:hypothetical protein
MRPADGTRVLNPEAQLEGAKLRPSSGPSPFALIRRF